MFVDADTQSSKYSLSGIFIRPFRLVTKCNTEIRKKKPRSGEAKRGCWQGQGTLYAFGRLVCALNASMTALIFLAASFASGLLTWAAMSAITCCKTPALA